MNHRVFCKVRGVLWLLLAAGFLRAEEPAPTVASRIPSLETGFERDHLTGDWGGMRARVVDRGFHLQAGYVAEWMGNISGGLRRGSVYQGLLELGLQADLERMGMRRGGTFLVSALYPHGKSLSTSYVGDLSTVSSIDAYDSFRLFEMWYEQPMGMLSVRVGQLAADQDFAVGVLWQRLGRDARELSNDLNLFNGTSSPTLDYELVVEFSYQFHARTWWIVQPDLQLLFHPGGSARQDTAVVAGIRSSLIF